MIKSSDYFFLFLFFIALMLLIALSELSRRRWNWAPERSRKLVHMATGIFVAFTPFLLNSMWPMIILGIVFAIINYLAIRYQLFKSMHHTGRLTFGTVFYPLSFVVLVLWLWNDYKVILVTAMLIMAIADAMAAVVGQRAKKPIPLGAGLEKKSLQGSVTMFFCTLFITIITLNLFQKPDMSITMNLAVSLWGAVLVASIATAGEMVSKWGSDNLTVPLFSAFVIYFFLSAPVIENVYFSVGLVMALVVSALSYRVGFLDFGGSVGAFLLGTLIFGVGGWSFTLPILTFFVLSSVLSHIGKTRKEVLKTVFEKSSRRDMGQVLANGGIAGLVLVIWYFQSWQVLYLFFIGALAAVTADTWATEIGVMARSNPRSILNWKPVPRGASGGVTLLGSLGAAAGSLILVVVGHLASPHDSPRLLGRAEFWLVFSAGLLASFVDSIIGATVQAQYRCVVCGKQTEKKVHCSQTATEHIRGYTWLNNDAVNALAALSGVLFVALGWLIFIR